MIDLKKRKGVKRKAKPQPKPLPPPTYDQFQLDLAVARATERAVDDRIVKDFMRNARAMKQMRGLNLEASTMNTVANVMSLMRVLERHGY